MSSFESSDPFSSSSGSSQSSGLRGPDCIPRTGSAVFRMVRTSAIGYRVSEYIPGRKQRVPKSIFPDPTNSDLDLASAYSSSCSDSQRTQPPGNWIPALGNTSSGFTISGPPRTPEKQVRAGFSGRPKSTSTKPTHHHWMPAKSPAPPLASPQSAKRAQSGASDMVGALLGKHPSAAESDAFDKPVEIVYRRGLGDGRQGTTYVAHLTKLQDYNHGILVFVKEMRKDFCLTYNQHSEVRANERLIGAAAVSHPNAAFVTRIHAFVDTPAPLEKYVFVYELHHHDLSVILNRPFSKSSKFNVIHNCPLWATQIAAAIEYLHGVGIIHRDIKPENILVDDQLNMRLTDLGTAFVSKSQMGLNPDHLYAYLACGTPLYMAPEMEAHAKLDLSLHREWRSADPDETEGRYVFYGSKVDWFSFGILFYEMVATFYRETRESFELTIRERQAALHAWSATVNDRMVLVSMAPWNKFMQTRRIPDELWGLLWRLLHHAPSQRGDSRALVDNPFFIQAGKRIFDVLADISFDQRKRPHRDFPSALSDRDYLRDAVPLKISNTQSIFLNRATKSWIDTNSCFFLGLNEFEGFPEDGESYDDEAYYYDY